MKIGIIGAGVVGTTLAVKLGQAGNDVHLYSRNPIQMNELRHAEVDLGGVFDDRFRLEHTYSLLENFLKTKYDFIFIAVKTPTLTEVLDELKAYGLEKTPLMSCQNGIGTEEEIAKRFGDAFAYRMVINFAGNVLDRFVVKIQFFHKPNYITCLSEKGKSLGKKIAIQLSKVGLDTEYKDNIKSEIFRKAILNCALSGVCALTRMSMDKAMNDPGVVEIVKMLLLEGMQVAHLEGANLGDDYFSNALNYLSHAGTHKPSMLVDIEKGRATEIDFLNYQILSLGRKHHVHVPFTNSITALVRALDQTVRRQ